MSLDLSRREFLKRASALSVAGIATPFALNLAAIGEAAAASASDYKALVCVFLYGGNDYANTLVPFDNDSYGLYRQMRPAIAIPKDSRLLSNVLRPGKALPDSRQYALAPELKDLIPYFDAKQLAVLLNVGTLIHPITKADYVNRTVPLPPKLFSHNDQQSVWQSSLPEGAIKGWGGGIGDLLAASNSNASFTCVSAAGNAVYLSGNQVIPYQISTNTKTGSIPIKGIDTNLFTSATCAEALRKIITTTSNHGYEAELAAITRRSIDLDVQLNTALSNVPEFTTPYPANNNLADQLKVVAKMVAGKAAMGTKRQIFFVSLSGFDTHTDISALHPKLLKQLGEALQAFQATLANDLGMADQVTTFTASDFGRTMTTDGDGSDHGWGSMHFVLGGAVKGGEYYGKAPVIANDGPDDVGQGRLLPSMAVDQLAATLASWFGVRDSDLPLVLPNITHYTEKNLGFMV